MLDVRLTSKKKGAELGCGGYGEGEFKIPARSLTCAHRLVAAWVRSNPDFQDCQAVVCSDYISDLGDRMVLEIFDYKDGKRSRTKKKTETKK
jgi:hypothetical protein